MGSPSRSPLLAVEGTRSQRPSLLHAWTAAGGDPESLPDVFFTDAGGSTLVGVESYRSRFTERKVLRHGESGNVMLTAKSRGLLWRRHWTLHSPMGDRVLDVHVSRLWWRRKRHGKGPVRYVLRAWRPDLPRLCLVAGPEQSRLVVRQYEGRRVQGDALCEASYGPEGALVSGGGTLAVLREGDGGCTAAVSPRADTALVCCLLAIYRELVGDRG